PRSLRGEGQGEGRPQATSLPLSASHPVSAPDPDPLPVKDGERGQTLRETALAAIAETDWVPETGENRIRAMVEGRPDWVVSRQRAWGVPITVFVAKADHTSAAGSHAEGDILHDPRVDEAIVAAFAAEGADAWFAPDAAERFLSHFGYDPAKWEKVNDVLDVWFDSGSTHAFTLEDPKAFPSLSGIRRSHDGGSDRVMYLEGSDQHRGWFQSSLLESCGTRGRAPYDVVLTHGFILDEKGEEKMSKSKGNVLSPQDVMKTNGADILRLWVASADTTGDIRFGPKIVENAGEAYKKLRNTIRWMLGSLAHHDAAAPVALADMPDLERLMLHRLAELDGEIRNAYGAFDFRKVISVLTQFMNTDLSAFYFDIRKDALYREPLSSAKRRAALTVIDRICDAVLRWLAPITAFTAEEAWLARAARKSALPGSVANAAGSTGIAPSVHLAGFAEGLAAYRNDKLAAKWAGVRDVRRVITGALELERAEKRIGSSLEAAPEVYVSNATLQHAIDGVDLAEIAITSGVKLLKRAPPDGAFTLSDVPGVGVVAARAEGQKCARSWRYTTDVGADREFPDLSARDAAAVREFDAANGAAI
ncbi:MAG: class I tRNA ligase family protein, partial [Hyphomicrobium aestuarii]|nr:class I tRNA ligase family protein [Hyphomicrobium aestuarii]